MPAVASANQSASLNDRRPAENPDLLLCGDRGYFALSERAAYADTLDLVLTIEPEDLADQWVLSAPGLRVWIERGTLWTQIGLQRPVAGPPAEIATPVDLSIHTTPTSLGVAIDDGPLVQGPARVEPDVFLRALLLGEGPSNAVERFCGWFRDPQLQLDGKLQTQTTIYPD